MAFFDFDRKLQTILIAASIASATACGGTTGLSGDTDADTDATTDTVVDTSADTVSDTGFDTWHPPDVVDPPPDMLDPDAHGVCPDTDTWAVTIGEQSVDFPNMTLRVTLNVPEEFIDDSSPEFTVEKRFIDDVRQVALNEYDIDYRWSGPLEYYWWDWDRLNVSWRVACYDASGTHEATVTQQRVICINEGYLYLGWDSDPESSCMVVDCVPDSMEEHSAPSDEHSMKLDSIPTDVPDGLPRGALSTRIVAVPSSDGTIRLSAHSGGALATHAGYTWSATSGQLDTSTGDTVVWHPPQTPGLHAVQVISTAGDALSIDVFKLEK